MLCDTDTARLEDRTRSNQGSVNTIQRGIGFRPSPIVLTAVHPTAIMTTAMIAMYCCAQLINFNASEDRGDVAHSAVRVEKHDGLKVRGEH